MASEVDYLLHSGLYFCTDQPLNADFEIYQQSVDLNYLKRKKEMRGEKGKGRSKEEEEEE